jgi:hypothetical protein
MREWQLLTLEQVEGKPVGFLSVILEFIERRADGFYVAGMEGFEVIFITVGRTTAVCLVG